MTAPAAKMTLGGLLGQRQTSWADVEDEEDHDAGVQAAPAHTSGDNRAPPPMARAQPAAQQQQQQSAPRSYGGDRDRQQQPDRRDDRRDDRQPRDDRRGGDDRRQGGGYQDRRDDRRGGDDRRQGGYGGDRQDDRRGGGGYGGDRQGQGYGGERAPRPQREKTPMPSVGPWKAYVGNLPYDVPNETITAFFEHDGNIKVTGVTVPRAVDDKPITHVYVEFADRESLENALKLDNADLQGRPCKIDVAAARQDSRGGGSYGNRSYGGDRSAEPAREVESLKERKKLALAPRSAAPAAAATASAAAAASKPDPFGGAKPREATLIARGVDPTTIDVEAAKPKREAKVQATADWQDVKNEVKANPANAKRAGDAPSHPVESTSGAAAAAAPARAGVMRGGLAGRPAGARAPASEKDAPAARKGQAPPTKKEKPAAAGPVNVFAALGGGDSDEEQEE